MANDNQKMIDTFSQMSIEQLEDIGDNNKEDYTNEEKRMAHSVLIKKEDERLSKPKSKPKITTQEIEGEVYIIGIHLKFEDVFVLVFQWTIASIIIGGLFYLIAFLFFDLWD